VARSLNAAVPCAPALTQTVGDGEKAVTGWVTDADLDNIIRQYDANRDGVVNFADYQILVSHFGATQTTWGMGDFNGDQSVSFNDYQILATHFGQHVPEPATLSLLVLGGLALIRRRRA